MRIVVQRVKSCAVFHEGEAVSAIRSGYMLLVCFKRNEKVDFDRVAEKILSIRLFEQWTKDVRHDGHDLMILSQFTLYAKFNGKKPSFHDAEASDAARQNFEALVGVFRKLYDDSHVKCGIFGHVLNIEAVLDGPCTVIIDI